MRIRSLSKKTWVSALFFSTFLFLGLTPIQPTPVKKTAEKDFTCKKLPGMSFRFPVFQGWEPISVQEDSKGCTIQLAWPSQYEFETARMVQVSRINDVEYQPVILSNVGRKDFVIGKVHCFRAHESPQSVLFGYAHDPALYADGFAPPPEHWDYLQFYGKRYGVRIKIDAGEPSQGFDTQAFVNQIVQTFKF